MRLYSERNGNQTEYIVNLVWDEEAHVWVAICDEIPLALESESLDELINRIRLAAPEIIELNKLPHRESVCFSMEKHERMVFA
ncbi:MAG: DUF1902 domain-containing protein [Selenomonadaceae bacterium]|nr:DUF1902 domain-containing protein [Selenomonadaceae bacterium]